MHLLRCVSLIKSKIGFLNLDKSQNGFCVSLLNRLIQNNLDHGVSKEPKKDSSVPLMHYDPSDLGLICLVKKRKIRFRIYRDLRIQSWILLKKRTQRQSLIAGHAIKGSVFPRVCLLTVAIH